VNADLADYEENAFQEMSPNPSRRINAWSSPRNISTALMYSFAQRPDTRVVDEPLYAHYLLRTKSEAQHPGRAEVLNSQRNDGQKVIDEVLQGPCDRPVVFFKQMTHHLIEIDWSFLLYSDHVLLIRDPRAIIGSYAKVVPNPGIEDVGIRKQYELFQFLEARDRCRAVLDTQELLRAPRTVLEQLCRQLDLPFYPEMLAWEPGPRPEDGVWAKYWYHQVHHSEGFQPYRRKTVELSPELETLAERCRPYYAALYEHAIKAEVA